MKNYFESGYGHLTNQLASKWFSDIAETLNKTYKKQMDLSIDMSNQLLNNSIIKESPTLTEGFWGMKILKSNSELFEKNLEMLSDLTKKMFGFNYGTFFNEKETNTFSDKISESIISTYEKQTRQIKEFNNFIFEMLGKNTGLDASVLIKNFRKISEDSLDASLENIKTLLKPNNKNSQYLAEANKKVLDEVTKQFDLISKSNLKFWSDFMTSIGQISKMEQKEKTHESKTNTMKEYRKDEVSNAKKQLV